MSHSRIFQISREKISKDKYITEDRYYDSFVGEIADYIDTAEDRTEDIKWLKDSLKGIATIDLKKGLMTITNKENYFKGFYEEFIKAAKEIAGAAFEDFCTTKLSFDEYHLRSMYNDCFDFYMDDNGECYGNQTLMNFLRNANNGDKFYIGQVFDYHY